MYAQHQPQLTLFTPPSAPLDPRIQPQATVRPRNHSLKMQRTGTVTRREQVGNETVIFVDYGSGVEQPYTAEDLEFVEPDFTPGDRVEVLSAEDEPELVGRQGTVQDPAFSQILGAELRVWVLLDGEALARRLSPYAIKSLSPHSEAPSYQDVLKLAMQLSADDRQRLIKHLGNSLPPKLSGGVCTTYRKSDDGKRKACGWLELRRDKDDILYRYYSKGKRASKTLQTWAEHQLVVWLKERNCPYTFTLNTINRFREDHTTTLQRLCNEGIILPREVDRLVWMLEVEGEISNAVEKLGLLS